MKRWVTIQLTERGENILEEDPTSIVKVLKKFIKSDYFIPLHLNKSKSYENRIFLFRGYIFSLYDEKETKNYFKLSGTQYFIGPLMIGSTLLLTNNDEIKKMKIQLLKITKPNIKIGDRVLVLDGKYKHMTAIVSEYYVRDKEADLTVELKCMNIIVPRVPVVCLKKMNDSVEKEIDLSAKVLELLQNSKKALTRKEILEILELSNLDRSKLSQILSKCVKKGLIKLGTDSCGKSVFFTIFKKWGT